MAKISTIHNITSANNWFVNGGNSFYANTGRVVFFALVSVLEYDEVRKIIVPVVESNISDFSEGVDADIYIKAADNVEYGEG